MAADLSHSPIGVIISRLEDVPYQVVPERADGLRRMVEQHGITIAVNPDKEDFHVNINKARKIEFGIPVLERLWAYAHAYVKLLVEVQKHPGGLDLDLKAQPNTRPAMELLEWAHDCERRYRQTPWPAGLPLPNANPAVGSAERKALDIYMNMLTWLMLHEICHGVLRHIEYPSRPTDEENHRQEFQAGEWASEWMLHERSSRFAEYDHAFLNRALGATITLAVFSSWEVRQRLGASPTHPDPANRLLRFLDEFVPEAPGFKATRRELPWMMAGTIMQLHLSNEMRRELTRSYDSFRGFMLDVVKVLNLG
jgi:Peptidase U49